MSDSIRHPDANDLAALAEGIETAGAADVRRHLARCRTCLAAYAEAVRVQDLAWSDPEYVALPAELAEAALAVTRPRRRSPVWRWAWAPAVAAAALAIMLLPRILAPGLNTDHVAAVQRALQEQSTSGMIYPGVDAGPATVYRSGGEDHGDLAAAVQGLAEQTGHEPADADAAYWLGAGYLAAGQVSAATDLLRQARRGHPEDHRLLVLDALASYRRSDLARAEQLLRSALLERPEDPMARFNLAVLLVDAGRVWEARQVLDSGDWPEDATLTDRVHALRDTLRASR